MPQPISDHGELEPQPWGLPEDPTFDADDEDVDPADPDEPDEQDDPYAFPLPFTDASDVQQISGRYLSSDFPTHNYAHLHWLLNVNVGFLHFLRNGLPSK